MTTIINLYGGPGTGKSTSAAYIFYVLKSLGKNTELVREYVKNWAWEGRKINGYDQLYFLGKQSRAESLLYGKVDYIVTDSPVLLGGFYADKYCPDLLAFGISEATAGFYNQAAKDGYEHIHIMLKRSKVYNVAGRYQTAEEAKEMDSSIETYLRKMSIQYIECDTNEKALFELTAKIIK